MACKSQGYCFITRAVLYTTKMGELQVAESNEIFFFVISKPDFVYCMFMAKKQTPGKKKCLLYKHQ